MNHNPSELNIKLFKEAQDVIRKGMLDSRYPNMCMLTIQDLIDTLEANYLVVPINKETRVYRRNLLRLEVFKTLIRGNSVETTATKYRLNTSTVKNYSDSILSFVRHEKTSLPRIHTMTEARLIRGRYLDILSKLETKYLTTT
tara:strand:+ start:658 stop:1086 length:429 start_codon:yes stop_codon:yes gene_type:complete